LISILLPSLCGARASAKTAKCAAHLAGLSRGLMTYAMENNDWLPGYNTTGVPVRAIRFKNNHDLLNRPDLPVQTFDWMTPLLALEMKLPASRAQRFNMLLTRYQCPAQAFTITDFYPSNFPQKEDFTEISDWPAVSYLMPGHFQWWGQKEDGTYLAPSPIPGFDLPIKAEAGDSDWEVVVPSYVSRLDRVGTPANKVFAADGTRYLDGDSTLDFDADPYASIFGAFCSAGAWWGGSREYGVKVGTQNWDGQTVNTTSPNPNEGEAMRISYRHGCIKKGTGSAQTNRGKMNAAFFDGHVDTMNDQQSRRIEYWYPKGAVVNTEGEGLLEYAEGYVIR